MSSEGIFLKVNDKLRLLKSSGYAFEAVLQKVLAEHPEVLAGVSTRGDRDARLLLISREVGVPSASGGAATFSLDHLFVDDEGTPVFVEVKRSSDTRSRREVVAQMLDYAANAVAYWPVSTLVGALEKRAVSEQRSVQELFAELQPSIDPDSFWDSVAGNLRQGRIRMIFVADEIPDSLARIIEFLNEQMNPAEVLGVEVRQFVDGEHVVYVPRLIGQTATAAQTKSAARTTTWTGEQVLEAARERYDGSVVALVEALLSDVEDADGKLVAGRATSPSVSGWYPIHGRMTGTWSLNTNTARSTTKPYLQLFLAELVPHIGEEAVASAARAFEQIPSMTAKVSDARAASWRKWPSVYLTDMAGDARSVEALLDGIRLLTLRAPSRSE